MQCPVQAVQAVPSHQRVRRIEVLLRQLHVLHGEVGARGAALPIRRLSRRRRGGGRRAQRGVAGLPRLCDQQDAVSGLRGCRGEEFAGVRNHRGCLG
jgi:hypothetical protein